MRVEALHFSTIEKIDLDEPKHLLNQGRGRERAQQE